MPPLSNTRRERFAQALALGQTQAEAYEHAGYKPNRHNASTLAKTKPVQNRVAEVLEETRSAREEIAAEAQSALVITEEWILNTLWQNVIDARAAGDYAPANVALIALGKAMAPHRFVDRIASSVTNANADLATMTPEQRAVEDARILKELGLQVIDGGLAGGTARKA